MRDQQDRNESGQYSSWDPVRTQKVGAAQLAVLALLTDDGAAWTVAEVCDALSIAPSHGAELLRSLNRRGFLDRTGPPQGPHHYSASTRGELAWRNSLVMRALRFGCASEAAAK